MTQVLIYSIQPEHVLNFLNGLKTIEVRKRDLPQWAKDKIDRGEVVQGYGYCTKGKPLLSLRWCYGDDTKGCYELSNSIMSPYNKILNGLVVAKFEVSGTTRYVDCSGCTNNENGYECQNDFMYLLSVDPVLRKATCLTSDEIEDYGNGADLYAHHITNVQPVNMELGEFYKHDYVYAEQKELPRERVMKQDGYLLATYDIAGLRWVIEPNKLTKAPQSFQSVWVKGE